MRKYLAITLATAVIFAGMSSPANAAPTSSVDGALEAEELTVEPAVAEAAEAPEENSAAPKVESDDESEAIGKTKLPTAVSTEVPAPEPTTQPTPKPTESAPAPTPEQTPVPKQSAEPKVTATPKPTATEKPAAPKPNSPAESTSAPKPEPTPTAKTTPKFTAKSSKVTTPFKSTSTTGDLRGVGRSGAKTSVVHLQGRVSTDGLLGGRAFVIQKKDPKTKKWLTHQAGQTDNQGRWYGFMVNTTKDYEVLRLIVKADSLYKTYTGPATTFKRTKISLVLKEDKIPSTIKTIPWNLKTLQFSMAKNTSGVTLQLQRLKGSKWVKVSERKTKPLVYNYSFKLPKGNKHSANSTLKYRVVSLGSAIYSKDWSKPVTVRWENPRRYTGMAKKVYSYIASRCPDVTITIDRNLAKQGHWGTASPASQRIAISPEVPAKHLKTIALHECSHFYQWKTYTNSKNGGRDKYIAAANRLMGTKGTLGLERVNECMSATWAPKSYWSYGASAALCKKPAVKSFVQKTLKGQKVS